MDKAQILALADRVEAEEGRLEFEDFVFHWFNQAYPIEMAECIKTYSPDRRPLADSLRAMVGGEDA